MSYFVFLACRIIFTFAIASRVPRPYRRCIGSDLSPRHINVWATHTHSLTHTPLHIPAHLHTYTHTPPYLTLTFHACRLECSISHSSRGLVGAAFYEGDATPVVCACASVCVIENNSTILSFFTRSLILFLPRYWKHGNQQLERRCAGPKEESAQPTIDGVLCITTVYCDCDYFFMHCYYLIFFSRCLFLDL